MSRSRRQPKARRKPAKRATASAPAKRTTRKPARTTAAETPKKRSKLKLAANIAVAGVGLAAVGLLAVLTSTNPGGSSNLTIANGYPSAATITPVSTTALVEVDQRKVETLNELLALEADERAEVDIARANLLVAKATPGAEGIDVEAYLAKIDEWAHIVAAETDASMHQFRRDPGNFENSEGYFRILSLITTLQRDLGVRYHPERINDPDFTNPADLFIHGMVPLADSDATGGTCVSMPVLYTAVARRLGYPVTLVTTKAHVFARWDGEGPNGRHDRFNIEATSQGLNVYDDEHYHQWPMPLSEEELASGAYLRSLEPDEELAVFFAARGHVFEDTGRLPNAIQSYVAAANLDRGTPQYAAFANRAMAMLQHHRAMADGSMLPPRPSRHARDPLAEHRRIMEINERNRQRLANPGGG